MDEDADLSEVETLLLLAVMRRGLTLEELCFELATDGEQQDC